MCPVINIVLIFAIDVTSAGNFVTRPLVPSRTQVAKPPVKVAPEIDGKFCVNDLVKAIKKGSIESSRGKVKLDKLLGAGSFGKVYDGYWRNRDRIIEHVAVKFQRPLFGPFDPAIPMPDHYAEIEHEYSIMSRMQSYDGFPRVYSPNYAGMWKYYVMEYVGKDVDTIRGTLANFRLPTLFALEVAAQMLERIRAVHAEGYVAYDIHLGNFLIGRNNKVYMIDLALAYPYRNKDRKHIKENDAPFHYGNMRLRTLASRREEKGKLSSRMDDVERFLYMVILMLKGRLPWENVKDIQQARLMKLEIEPDQLCKSRLLSLLAPVFDFIFALPFDADPPYAFIHSTLATMKAREQADTK